MVEQLPNVFKGFLGITEGWFSTVMSNNKDSDERTGGFSKIRLEVNGVAKLPRTGHVGSIVGAIIVGRNGISRQESDDCLLSSS